MLKQDCNVTVSKNNSTNIVVFANYAWAEKKHFLFLVKFIICVAAYQANDAGSLTIVEWCVTAQLTCSYPSHRTGIGWMQTGDKIHVIV